MQNEFDSKRLLRIFEKIRLHGEKSNSPNQQGEYVLGGIKAFSDFDGYTIFLEDAKVKLSFGFHNTYHFDYSKPSDLEGFEKKLNAIDKQYS